MGNFGPGCRRNYNERESRVDPYTCRLGECHRRHRLSWGLSYCGRAPETRTGRKTVEACPVRIHYNYPDFQCLVISHASTYQGALPNDD